MMKPTQEVFELVLARPAVWREGEDQSLTHLWWSAAEQGERLVQVYVDGELTDVSSSPSQREMVLMLDRRRAHRIELLAVSVDGDDDVWQPQARFLNQWWEHGHFQASVSLIRDERLPVDSRVLVEVDGELTDTGMMWPADEARGGFGSLFGLGDFGYDAATGLGLGVGELGVGLLGRDGTAWRWRRSDLAAGQHEVAVSVVDRCGNAVSDEALRMTAEVVALPKVARDLKIAKDWTLSWSV